MTNAEFKEKITAINEEYMATSQKEEFAILYLVTAEESSGGFNLEESLLSVKGNPLFASRALIEFCGDLHENIPSLGKALKYMQKGGGPR